MTLDELKERLKAAGANGQWVETPGGSFEPEAFTEQRERLAQIKGHLERQLTDDLQLVALLREELNRVKHGGGS